LTGIRITGREEARQAATQLLEKGVENVLITMGAAGVWVANGKVQQFVRGFEVSAVDTTGAGDVFCGALAVASTEQQNLICYRPLRLPMLPRLFRSPEGSPAFRPQSISYQRIHPAKPDQPVLAFYAEEFSPRLDTAWSYFFRRTWI
jgi:hypothetical protein